MLVQSPGHSQTSEICSPVRSKLGRHLLNDFTLGKCCFPQSKDLQYLQLLSNAGGTGTLLLSGLSSRLNTNTTDWLKLPCDQLHAANTPAEKEDQQATSSLIPPRRRYQLQPPADMKPKQNQGRHPGDLPETHAHRSFPWVCDMGQEKQYGKCTQVLYAKHRYLCKV